MLIFTVTPDDATAFAMGFVTAVALLFIIILWAENHYKKKEEREEFEAWKKARKEQTPEVVDAQFVTVSKPQLNSSQALVTRRSLERRKP